MPSWLETYRKDAPRLDQLILRWRRDPWLSRAVMYRADLLVTMLEYTNV